MSVINSPNDGIVSTLVVCCKCLLTWGEMTRERLLGLCAPVSVVADQGYVNNTINTWVKLGFLSEVKNKIKIKKEEHHKLLEKELDKGQLKSLPVILRRVLLSGANNPAKLFWEKEEDIKACDFSRGAAWYLLQDPFIITSAWRVIVRLGQTQLVLGKESSEVDTDSQEGRVFVSDITWGGVQALGYVSRYRLVGSKWRHVS